MNNPFPVLRELSDDLDMAPLLMEGQGREFANPPWEEAGLRVLIARLSPFDDVCRSTPHLFLYRACRASLENAFLDFAFFPSASDRLILEKNGLPLMFGVASLRGMSEFDLVLVSNSYTLELINLPLALARSGIPRLRSLRDSSPVPSPLFILGGSNASASSALLEDPVSGKGDSFADAIFFGEGETEVPALLSAIAAQKRIGPGFTSQEKSHALLLAGQAAPGLFYPGKKERTIQARAFSPLQEVKAPAYPLLNSPEANSYKIPISSGCPSFCTFCMESWDRKPYREFSPDALLAEARAAKLTLGASSVDIASFNFNAHSDAVRLLLGLSRVFFRQNAMSQRADILESLPGLLHFEFASGKRSFTVGIEGISERMRRYYAKELETAPLESLLARLLSSGARELKLFYIISGLETEDDIEEFAAFVKDLKRRKADSSSATRIVFSTGYLTRMPGTPLAFAPLAMDESLLRRVAGPVKSACDTNGFEFRLPAHFDEYALGQTLALGGPALFPLLSLMADKGFCYDKGLSRGAWEFARAFLESSGHFSPAFLGEKDAVYPFSLAFLDFSVSGDFRHNRYLAARAALESPRHSKRDAERSSCLSSSCLACGACPQDSSAKDSLLAHVIAAPSLKDVENAENLMRLKAKAGIVNARIEVPEELDGAESAFLSAYYLRRLLSDLPEQADNALECEECLFTTKETRDRFPSFSGTTVFRFRAYDAAALRSSLASLPWLRLLEGEPSARFSLSQAKARISIPKIVANSPAASELEKSLSAYLNSELATFTLSRKPPEKAAWEMSRQGLKKRIIDRAFLEDGPERAVLELDIGSRFDFRAFLGAFRQVNPRRSLPRIRFLSIDPENTKPC